MAARKPFRFDYTGVDLNAAVDNMPPQRCPICTNWRVEADGTLSPRPGQGAGSFAAIQTLMHSVRRLTDTSSGSSLSAFIVGCGTHVGTLATDLSSPVDVEGGYSGDPLSLVVHKPPQSTKRFIYISDRSRMRKIDQSGAMKNIGLTQPRTPPTAVMAAPSYKAVEEFNNAGAWTQGGTAAAPTNNVRVDAATRSVTVIVYDNGTGPGWALVRPNSMADIGRGMRITFAPAGVNETATVEDVFKGSAASAFAVMATGATGEYSIHPSTPIDVEVGSLVQFSGTTEYARVKSVQTTQDGVKSFIISGVILSPTGNVQAFAAFRVYLVNTHGAVALAAASVQFAVTTGVGFITQTISVDLSSIATGVQTLPDDRLHVSVFIDHPELISEIKLYLDIDGAVNDFTRNYLQKILRSNDFAAIANNTQTLLDAQRNGIQRSIIGGGIQRGVVDESGTFVPRNFPAVVIDDPVDPSVIRLPNKPDLPAQISSGQSQYAEIFWRASEFLTQDIGRVGTDISRGLANVAALKVAVICTGNVIVRVDGWWLGGGFGPDIAENELYAYRYRYRDSSTGVVSNWSPPLLGGIAPRRQKAILTAFASGDGEVDYVDFFRHGGPIVGWHFLGATPHSSLVLNDTYPDSDLENLGALTDQQAADYKLWPQHSIPVSGTVTAVGSVVVPAVAVNDKIAPGTRMRIGQDWHIIQRIKSGGATIFIADSAGNQAALTPFEIPDPLLLEQTLPVLAGPFFGFNFGLGDKVNPQRLYYANGNQCDSTHDDQFIDVESEVLQNIVGGEDWAILFTTGGIYSIEPSFQLASTGGNLFRWRRIPSTTGLFARWAVCIADVGAAFLGKDGIYFTAGGVPQLLTEDLRLIFPHEGSLGVATNGFFPPNMVAAQKTNMRLSYVDNELIFDYIDTSGVRRCIVRRHKPIDKSFGWRIYQYATAPMMHYDEEGEDVHGTVMGGIDGKLYRLARNQGDNLNGILTAISATLQTPSVDPLNEPVARKRFNGVWMDYDTDGGLIAVAPATDNNGNVLTASNLNEAAGRRQRYLPFVNGQGVYGRNLDLAIVANVTTQRPILYLWEAVYEAAAEPPYERTATEIIDLGGLKFIQGVTFDVDTENVPVNVDVYVDQNLLQTTIQNGANSGPLNAAGRGEVAFAFDVPFLAHQIRFVPSGAWHFYGAKLHARPDTELAYMWKTQQTACGMPAFKYFGDGYISVRSTENFRFFIIGDGIMHEVTFYDANLNTAGERRRFRFRCPAFKAKSVEFQAFALTTAGRVAPYEADFELEIKPWSHEGGWLTVHPLGGDHHDRGADI